MVIQTLCVTETVLQIESGANDCYPIFSKVFVNHEKNGHMIYHMSEIYFREDFPEDVDLAKRERLTPSCGVGDDYCVCHCLDLTEFMGTTDDRAPPCAICGVLIHLLCNRVLWTELDVQYAFTEPSVRLTPISKRSKPKQYLCVGCMDILYHLEKLKDDDELVEITSLIQDEESQKLDISHKLWDYFTEHYNTSMQNSRTNPDIGRANMEKRAIAYLWETKCYQAFTKLICDGTGQTPAISRMFLFSIFILCCSHPWCIHM